MYLIQYVSIMKKATILTTFLITSMFFYGQNIMFYPLHYSYEYDYVMHYLGNLPADEIREPIKGIVQAKYDGFAATYYFNDKKELYKVETIKSYDKQARMKTALHKANRFLKLLNVTMYETKTAITEKKWAGRTKLPMGMKVKKEYEFDLMMRKYAANDMEVTLGGICLQRKPVNEPNFIPSRKNETPKTTEVTAKSLKEKLE